ncbi:MAG: hypothetical protein M1308_01280, partial [Actinobacteria bacterium]|nr:hypothetical protein [Actinomycetota bacterium]
YQPKSPLMQMIVLYAGITNTINLMLDNKRLFDETILSLEGKADEAAELTLNSPAEFIMIPENLSSIVIGKKLFEEYLRPYHEKWNKKIRARGKYSFIHFDGCLRGLLKEVASEAIFCNEAMTPEPGGDLPVEEFSKYVDSDSIMWGGLPGILFVPSVNDDDFEKYVLKVIRLMTSEPRYVLGIADQIPPDGIIERVKKVTELIEKYAIYHDKEPEKK